jgi:hypothetical protein
MEWINYTSRNQPEVIVENTTIVLSDCTSIVLQNKGTLGISMKMEGVPVRLESGEFWTFGNDPDVREKTEFRDIVFDTGAGTKLLFVIRQFLTPTPNYLQ